MMRLLTAVLALGLLGSTAALAEQQSGPLLAQAGEGQYVVYFPLGKAALDAEALTVVQAAAEDYRRTGSTQISVRGHTDTSGNADYNQALSERRAQAVADELIRLGVPAGNITRTALGETDLAVQTGNGVPEKQNRRVDIAVEQPTPAPQPAPPPVAVAPAPVAPPPEPKPETAPKRGQFSLGAIYGLNLKDEGDDDNEGISHLGGLNLSFDYALTPWLGLDLEQAGLYNFGSEAGFVGRSAAGLNFRLGNQTFIPYVGANVGYLYGSGIDDDFFAGPEIGISYRWLNAKIAYDMPFDRSVDEGIVTTTVGLGIRF